MIPLFFASIYTSMSQSLSAIESLGQGTYLFYSCLTTAGLTINNEINQLSEGVMILAVVAMTIGGGMGSTSGGVKQYRFVIAFKALYWSLRDRAASKRKFFSHNVYRLGKTREITRAEISESYGYLILYVTVLVIGGLAITILGKNQTGYTAADCLFEFSSALSSGGITAGVTAGSGLPLGNVIAIRWILAFGMLAGRLELICLYYAFYRMGRDILRKPTY